MWLYTHLQYNVNKEYTQYSTARRKRKYKKKGKKKKTRSDVRRTQKLFGLKRMNEVAATVDGSGSSDNNGNECCQSSAKMEGNMKKFLPLFLPNEYENIYGILCIIRHAYVNRKTK